MRVGTGLSLDDALDICRKCIDEIKLRFMVDVGDFMVKVVDKDGVREIEIGSKNGSNDGKTLNAQPQAMDTA